MCGPAVAWDWIVLDIAFVMLLIGSAVILRTRNSAPSTWITYGVTSALVGSFLMRATFETQRAMAAMGEGVQGAAMLVGC